MIHLAPNEVAWLALEVGKWEEEDATIMTAICYPESGGNIMAVNNRNPPNFDLGLFQISTRWNYDKLQQYRWRDPFDNVRMARIIFDEFERRPEGDGFLAWSVYKNESHKDYMELAELAVQHPWEPIDPFTTPWRTLDDCDLPDWLPGRSYPLTHPRDYPEAS